MTDQTLDDVSGDDPRDPRVEVLQAVLDRLVSWQEGADAGTVRTELDRALAEAGVEVDAAVRQRIVDRVSGGETPHFDVREVL
jgi:hypothetical protein